MRTFRSFIRIESGRFVCARNGILALLFFVTAMSFIQDGTLVYKAMLKDNDNFTSIEKVKSGIPNDYSQYGAYGLRIQFVASPLSIFFFNSGRFSELTAGIDVGERLNIYSSLKGKDLFKDLPGSHADFSGLMFLFGSLIVLFYGFEGFRGKEYLQMFSGFKPGKKIWWYILCSRYLIINLVFLVVFLSGILLVRLNGVIIPAHDYIRLAGYFLLWLAVSSIFLTAGSMFASIPSKYLGFMAVILAWIFSIYVFPTVVNKITTASAKDIPPNYRQELEKFTHLMGFETRALEKLVTYKSSDAKTKPVRELVESFLAKEYEKIRKIEKQLQGMMRHKIDVFQWVSVLYPSTFFSSTAGELSSKGFINVTGFYRYTFELKDKFCAFYKKKKFYSNDKKVESFIKGDENVYYGVSVFPVNFWWGILVCFFYLGVLSYLSYRFFIKLIFRLGVDSFDKISSEKSEEGVVGGSGFKPVELELKKGEFRILRSEGSWFKDYLFNIFSGRGAETGSGIKIIFSGLNIAEKAVPQDMLLLCHPDLVPGEIKVKDMVSFITGHMVSSSQEKKQLLEELEIERIKTKRFKHLKRLDKFKIILAMTRVRKFSVFIFHDITRKMPVEAYIMLKARMEEICRDGGSVIFLTEEHVVIDDRLSNNSSFFESTLSWATGVDRCREMLNKEKEKKEIK